MRIGIGSDHAGAELRTVIGAHLREAGHDVVDCTGPEIRILREGAIPATEIEAALDDEAQLSGLRGMGAA